MATVKIKNNRISKMIFVVAIILILSYLMFFSTKNPSKPIDFAIEWFNNNGYGEAECRTYETGFDVIDDKFVRLLGFCPAISQTSHTFQYNGCKSCYNKPFVCAQTAYPIVFTDEKVVLAVFKPSNEGFRLDNIDKGSFLYCSKV